MGLLAESGWEGGLGRGGEFSEFGGGIARALGISTLGRGGSK